MTKSLEEEITSIVAKMDEKQNEQQETDKQTSPNEVQDIYVLIVREHEGEEEDQTQIVESTPAPVTIHPQKTSLLPAYAICLLYIFLIISTITFQFYLLFNPPNATVTIIPRSQTVTLNGTLQTGRLLNPITISQSQTTPTTGRGHQDARTATGTVTFYNGQQDQQTVAQGTVLTGSDGVSIETTQSATIPPGSPSTGYGTVTVIAQALQAGSQGNIRSGDVNTPIALAVFVKNNQFTGGQNERDFSTVSTQDINELSTPLKTTLAQSMQGALQGQLKPDEQMLIFPCSPTVTSDHPIGAEATQVKVTISETCSSVAYNSQELDAKAATFLATQAQHKTGAGYSLFGTVHISVKQASVSSTPHPLVFLSFQAQGIWIYALSQTAQEQIKHLIAGKSAQEAAQLLASLPGIERATLHFSGIGDPERVPKSTQYIHLVLLVL